MNHTEHRPLIPIVVGVTGHRTLLTADKDSLYSAVYGQLCALRERYPATPVIVLSSLAEGADQLCAKAALETGCALVVPLPMAPECYLEDFSPEGKALFCELLPQAEHSFVVPAEEKPSSQASRGFLYRQAGIYIAMHSHILLALWDGVELRDPAGGGTFETVDFMLHGGWRNAVDEHAAYFKSPQDGMVWHILTPRSGAQSPSGQPFLLHILSNGTKQEQWPQALSETERFNQDVLRMPDLEACQQRAEAELLGKEPSHALPFHSRRLLALFGVADGLSLQYRRLRLRVLRRLSGLSTVLVLLFLLYDELESDLMLPLYALLLIFAFFLYRHTKKREYHRKYIQYRLFAEALRVQFYWEIAGVDAKIWEQYTWAQKDDIIWIKEALAALDIAPPDVCGTLPDTILLLQSCWIDGQLAYHRAARHSKGMRLRQNGRIASALLAFTVVVFALTFIFEFFAGELMLVVIPTDAVSKLLLIHEEQDITVRSLLKILLGIAAAGTALLSHYFSKLSLAVQVRDNARMAGLYAMAQKHLAQFDLLEDQAAVLQLLFHLGREAVVENGNWMLDYLEQSPDFVI